MAVAGVVVLVLDALRAGCVPLVGAMTTAVEAVPLAAAAAVGLLVAF